MRSYGFFGGNLAHDDLPQGFVWPPGLCYYLRKQSFKMVDKRNERSCCECGTTCFKGVW
jgi:hypothetical protein